MTEQVVYPFVLILLAIIGFFLRSLVKNIEEAKNGIVELNKVLAQHIERQSSIERDVKENRDDIRLLREKFHKGQSDVAAIFMQVERLKDAQNI